MWIFFRSQNFETAIHYILGIFSETIMLYPNFTGVEKVHQILLLIAVFFTIEWLGRENQFAIEKLELKFPQTIRWIFYYSIIFLICLFSGNGEQFIYFQF